MDVKRLLIIMTTVLVGAMFFCGLYLPDAPLMWLAETTISYAYMRAALVAVLLVLLITNPPRSSYFRTFIAAFSIALGISTIVLSYGYAIGLLDAIVFVEVAIILMIESLESDVEAVKKIHFKYTFANKK